MLDVKILKLTKAEQVRNEILYFDNELINGHKYQRKEIRNGYISLRNSIKKMKDLDKEDPETIKLDKLLNNRIAKISEVERKNGEEYTECYQIGFIDLRKTKIEQIKEVIEQVSEIEDFDKAKKEYQTIDNVVNILSDIDEEDKVTVHKDIVSRIGRLPSIEYR